MKAMRVKRSQSSILVLPATKLIKPTTSRRSFFSMLGFGLAGLITAPSVIGKLASEPTKDFGSLVWHGELKPAPLSYWSSADVEAYNKLPFYLAKMEHGRAYGYATYSKLLSKRKWEPNMGSVMRAVKK